MFGLNFLIPLIASGIGAAVGKKKQKSVTEYPEYQAQTQILDQQRQRMTNTAPLYDMLLRMSMGRLPGYLQNDPGIQNFTGIDSPPRAVQRYGASGRPIAPSRTSF